MEAFSFKRFVSVLTVALGVAHTLYTSLVILLLLLIKHLKDYVLMKDAIRQGRGLVKAAEVKKLQLSHK